MQQKDASGLVVFDSEIKSTLPPKNNKAHLNTLLSILDKTKIGDDTNISKVLHLGAEKIKKKGLIILISDLLDEPSMVLDSLKHFKYNQNDVLVFHILDPKELNLNYNERIVFEDFETKEIIEAEPWQISKSYKKEMNKFIKFYKNECSLNKIDYNLLLTNQNLDLALYQFLNKRKKLL